MPRVVVTDASFSGLEVEEEVLKPLGCTLEKGTDPSPAALAKLVVDADAVITQFAPVKAEVIEAMNRATVIVRYGIGVDNVDLDAAKRLGIPVCNVPDYCINEVADHTLALMLNATRRIDAHAVSIRAGEWKLVTTIPAMRALAGATVGVVGFGRIGREVVKRLLAFNSKVVVFDPVVPAADVAKLGATAVDLPTLFADSDVITLHCPSTAKTRKMINADTLGQMKQGSVLINVGRGDLVDQPAMIAALESGKLIAAGLDVTDPEPLPLESPLRKMPQVAITPHIASVSVKAVRKLRETVAQLAAMGLRGEPLPSIVNGVEGPRKVKA